MNAINGFKRGICLLLAVVMLTTICTPLSLAEELPSPASNPTAEETATPEPTPEATATPETTPEPTSELTATPEPTSEPTATPETTPEPTATPEPTSEPTATPEPTSEPTATPEPTSEPTAMPEPTSEPTAMPEPTSSPVPFSPGYREYAAGTFIHIDGGRYLVLKETAVVYAFHAFEGEEPGFEVFFALDGQIERGVIYRPGMIYKEEDILSYQGRLGENAVGGEYQDIPFVLEPVMVEEDTEQTPEPKKIRLDRLNDALVNSDVLFSVSAPEAAAVVLEVYDESGALISSEALELTEGAATFTRRVESMACERLAASAVVGEETYTAELTVDYGALGELEAPLLLSKQEFIVGEPVALLWTAVEGAEAYRMSWTKPDGEASEQLVVQNSVSLPMEQVDLEGGYEFEVSALKTGYIANAAEETLMGLDADADFEVDESGVLTKYLGAGGDVTVPEKVNGVTVREIGYRAFAACTDLTSVSLPGSVSKIGSGAFMNCNNLNSISIPAGVTEISGSTFENCTNLKSVSLPEGLTSIGSRAFNGCDALTSLHIPDSVSALSGDAFSCKNLREADIPSSWSQVSTPGNRSPFMECPALTSITIPDGMKAIPSDAFNGMASLSSISIPDSVTEIGLRAFVNCTGLTSVSLPGSVSKIGSDAFKGSGLNSISIPAGVTQINDSTFENCANLKSVSLPEGLTRIGAYAFKGCAALTSLHIPDSVNALGGDAFSGSSLNTVNIPLNWNQVSTPGNRSPFMECPALTSITIPDGMKAIPSDAFNGMASLSSISIPDSVTEIGLRAFVNCTGLTSVSLLGSVNKIGSDAFKGSGLNSISIPAGVTEINDSTFENCANLKSVSLPEGLTRIGAYAFKGCSALTKVSLYDGIAQIDENSGLSVEGSPNLSFEIHVKDMDAVSVAEQYAIDHNIPYTKGPYGEEPAELVLTADKTEVWTLEDIQFTVQGPEGLQYIELRNEDGEMVSAVSPDESVPGRYVGWNRFTKAGIYQFVAYSSDEALVSEPVTITAKSLGKLEKPVLTYEPVQKLSEGLKIEWSLQGPATGVYCEIEGFHGGLGGFHEGGILTGPLEYTGLYTGTFKAVAYQYDESDPVEIEIQVVDDSAVSFTMDKISVATGEEVHFEIAAPGATQVQLVVDGEAYDTCNVTDGKAALTRAFTKSGERQVAFRALVDGVWTEPCAAQTLTVTSNGPLAQPVVTVEPQHVLGADVPVSWTAVEHATSYRLRVRDAQNNILYEEDLTETSTVIDASKFPAVGTYSISVMAMGEGYDQSESEAAYTEIIDRLPGPVILTPFEGEALPEQRASLTWQAVDGAQIYVVTLARKTGEVDADGQPIYEKVWSPDTVNVGTALSYSLENLVYGAEYRVAVGAVYGEKISWSERRFSVEAPIPGKLEVTYAPTTVFADGKHNVVTFTIRSDANTMNVDLYLHEDGEDRHLGTLYADYADQDTSGRRVYTYVHTFEEAGEYTFHFTPVNAQGEWSDPTYVTVTVLPEGKLPDPVLSNLQPNDILLDANYTVRWEAAEIVDGMDFGGYCVLLCEMQGDVPVALEVMPGRLYMFQGMNTWFTLPALTAGKRYQIEVYAVHEGMIEPTDALCGVTKVQFEYRTVPAFSLKSVKTEGSLNSPITVTWNPPVWPNHPEQKPTKYIVWCYGPGLPYNEVKGENAKAFDWDGSETSFTLGGEYTSAAGTYTIDVYAILDKVEVSTMATGNNVAVIEEPSITIDYPTPQNNTYLTTDWIEVGGTTGGGIKQVLVRLVKNGAPVDLKDWEGNAVQYHIVSVENKSYYARLIPKEAMEASDSTGTNYAVEVYGYISDGPIVHSKDMTGYDAKDKRTINVNDDRILSVGLKDHANYAFVKESVSAFAKTNAAVTSILFTLDGSNESIGGRVTGYDNPSEWERRFVSASFRLDTEGKHTLVAYTQNGHSGKEPLYGVTPVAGNPTMYYNDTTTPLTMGALPDGRVSNRFSAPCEATVLGKCMDYLLVQVNGKKGFVQSGKLSEVNLLANADWEIQNENDQYLIVSSNDFSLRGEYVLVVRRKGNASSAVAYMYPNERIKNEGTGYYHRFEFNKDLILVKDATYEAAIVPYWESFDALQIIDFPYEFTYGISKGITLPTENSNVQLWKDGSIDVRWRPEKNARTYTLKLYFLVDGKEIEVFTKQLPATANEEETTVYSYSIKLEEINLSLLPEDVRKNDLQARITLTVN